MYYLEYRERREISTQFIWRPYIKKANVILLCMLVLVVVTDTNGRSQQQTAVGRHGETVAVCTVHVVYPDSSTMQWCPVHRAV